MTEIIPITTQLENIRTETCNEYCKFPEVYTPDEWEEKFEEICSECLFNRI